MLSKGRHPCPDIDFEKALAWVQNQTGIALATAQREALRTAIRSKVMVITGGPGVGKTTLVNSILKIIAAKKLTVVLCAPTGRAAKRHGRDHRPGGQDHPPAAGFRSRQRAIQAQRRQPAGRRRVHHRRDQHARSAAGLADRSGPFPHAALRPGRRRRPASLRRARAASCGISSTPAPCPSAG